MKKQQFSKVGADKESTPGEQLWTWTLWRLLFTGVISITFLDCDTRILMLN